MYNKIKIIICVIIAICLIYIPFKIRDNYINNKINAEYQVNTYNQRKMWTYQDNLYTYTIMHYDPITDEPAYEEQKNTPYIFSYRNIYYPDDNIVFEIAHNVGETDSSYYLILYGDRTVRYIKGPIVADMNGIYQDIYDEMLEYYGNTPYGQWLTLTVIRGAERGVKKLSEEEYVELIQKLKVAESKCNHLSSFRNPRCMNKFVFNGNYYPDQYVDLPLGYVDLSLGDEDIDEKEKKEIWSSYKDVIFCVEDILGVEYSFETRD